MQLYYSLTSPYARKCHIILHLHDLLGQTELILTDQFAQQFREVNPLGKIPSLKDADLTLIDSPLICEYLDTLAVSQGKQSLFKRDDANYFPIQLQHVLANGLLDAAVASVYEKRRETEPSAYWLERWGESLKNTVTQAKVSNMGTVDEPNIASVAMITALAYLDFRLPELEWRNWNAELAAWYEPFTHRPWFENTRPE